ncbi:hypothetical protein BO78DRAFT_445095 [Aspergillus sclerotiicarbonarius CBS 121057]|uniref:Uncharacterized protein n=1 Tax=Aspergillus sclerotiicarbonarius (strain CBS 121057 / IBT 28362) TaxID=1448318 RepID=A0A319EGH7_ASPSB|nr:hypothetical protein BO78DRAFT_445095 [Aspergillus sclerotiicarbonarius CBS 121057]
MIASIGCSISGGKSGPGEKREGGGGKRETRGVWWTDGSPATGGRWQDGTQVARAESDGKGKKKTGVGRGWAVGGESFYQALGYVSGGITQSRSESGEQEARKGESRCKVESQRCRTVEGNGGWEDEWARTVGLGRREVEERGRGVGAGWMDGWSGFTQTEQRWPGSVTIHPHKCTLSPPMVSSNICPDAN